MYTASTRALLRKYLLFSGSHLEIPSECPNTVLELGGSWLFVEKSQGGFWEGRMFRDQWWFMLNKKWLAFTEHFQGRCEILYRLCFSLHRGGVGTNSVPTLYMKENGLGRKAVSGSVSGGRGGLDPALLPSGGRGEACQTRHPGRTVCSKPGHICCPGHVLCAFHLPFLQTLKVTHVGVTVVEGDLYLPVAFKMSLGALCAVPPPHLLSIFGGHPRALGLPWWLT